MYQNDYALVSIALTTYNGGKYLPELLDSLLQQTYPNIEIVAVDDISSDNSVEILKRFSSQHPNFKIFVNEKNLGFVKNYEKVISLCSGEFIAPCDQDDFWMPEKIKRKIEEIDNYPMIYCDSIIANENLVPINKKISDKVNCKTYTNCLNYTVTANIYGHASLFRRSLYEAAPDFPVYITHDWWLAFNATFFGGAKFLPEPLVLYRQHKQNLFGIIGNKKKEHNKEAHAKTLADKRGRINAFYNICPDNFIKEKKVIYRLKKSYENFSLKNDFVRMFTFFANYKTLLAVKKRNTFRNLLFCLKMFVKIK